MVEGKFAGILKCQRKAVRSSEVSESEPGLYGPGSNKAHDGATNKNQI
jgi:hypothetical protein